MRKIISSLTLCLFWIIPIASQTTSDTHRAQLVGPVKSVEFYLVGFAVKNGANVEESRRTVRSTTYNTQGKILEDVSYDQYGAISQKLVYTYDSEGRGTGYNEYAALLDKSLTIPRRHVYRLDDKGRRVEYTVFESNGSVGTRFVYKYDVNGNLSEEEWYAHTGQLGGKTVSTFDEKGNQTSQAYYGGDGSLSWRNASKYDSSGNRTELLQYHGDTFRYKIISSYDKKGRILENETFEFNGIPGLYSSHAPKPGKVVYAYNDEERTKEVATYEVGGTLKGSVVYAYDERQNEIGVTTFNGDDPTNGKDQQNHSLIKIEYDSQGNWTRKTRLTQSDNGEPPQPFIAELRVITYY